MNYKIQINEELKKVLQLPTEAILITISEENLQKHMLKRNHENMIKYVPKIKRLISNPDYVGKNKNVKGTSFECITVLEDNVLVAIRLDYKENQFYVASLYDVTDSKLKHMIENGRVIKFDKKNNE